MSVFDPGVEAAGPAWTRHNLSDHDDVFTQGAGHLADIAYNARTGQWVTNSAVSVPTLAAGAGVGTAPPAPTLTLDSNDDRGTIGFGTGTAPVISPAVLVVVTFGTPLLTPQPLNQQLVSNAASGQATLALNPKLALPTPGTVVTVAAGPGAQETPTVLSVNYATGVVTLTANLANTHNAPALGSAATQGLVSWTIAKLPYIDLQELTANTRNLFIFPSAITATGFSLSYATGTIAASQPANTFQVTYKVEG